MRQATESRVTRRPARWRRGLAALALPPLCYLLAAVAGALLPVNHGWRQPERGVPLFVRTNGVHTALVLPVRAAGLDWRGLIPPGDFARAVTADDHLAFGWGHREFYLETPRWVDLKPGVALRALTGLGGTLMHVGHLPDRRRAPDLRPFCVTPAQYRRLAAFIRGSFAPLEGQRPASLPGYTASDRFFEARGRYDLFGTSNTWTGEALAHAGVRIGVWTPFSGSIMWRFPASRAASPCGPA